MTHDPACPAAGAEVLASDCACDVIAEVVKRERLIYQQTWAANLPKIEKRNYDQGFHDGSAK